MVISTTSLLLMVLIACLGCVAVTNISRLLLNHKDAFSSFVTQINAFIDSQISSPDLVNAIYIAKLYSKYGVDGTAALLEETKRDFEVLNGGGGEEEPEPPDNMTNLVLTAHMWEILRDFVRCQQAYKDSGDSRYSPLVLSTTYNIPIDEGIDEYVSNLTSLSISQMLVQYPLLGTNGYTIGFGYNNLYRPLRSGAYDTNVSSKTLALLQTALANEVEDFGKITNFRIYQFDNIKWINRNWSYSSNVGISEETASMILFVYPVETGSTAIASAIDFDYNGNEISTTYYDLGNTSAETYVRGLYAPADEATQAAATFGSFTVNTRNGMDYLKCNDDWDLETCNFCVLPFYFINSVLWGAPGSLSSLLDDIATFAYYIGQDWTAYPGGAATNYYTANYFGEVDLGVADYESITEKEDDVLFDVADRYKEIIRKNGLQIINPGRYTAPDNEDDPVADSNPLHLTGPVSITVPSQTEYEDEEELQETLNQTNNQKIVYPEYDPNETYDPDSWTENDPVEEAQPDPYAEPDYDPYEDPDYEPETDPLPEAIEETGTDPEGGEPVAPIPSVPPTFTATSLYKMYNPTGSQLSSLATDLWSNGVSELVKLFTNDPMEAIISLGLVPFSPTVGASSPIVLGTYPTNVSAPVITDQFKTISCGTVDVPMKYNNFLDMEPYTEVDIYLPFIGFKSLSPNDVMGGTISLTYYVDVMTGDGTCEVVCSNDRVNQVLYNFPCNMKMEIPLTGSNRSRLLSSAVAAVAAVATKGASAGLTAGAIGTAAGAFSQDVERSGSLAGNAGFTASFTPYVIIRRPVPTVAANYQNVEGYSTNELISLGSISGYNRVKEVHLNGLASATDSEISEIETLLKNGVIF